MDENTLYAHIHDQMRREGYIVNYYDVARIVELYQSVLLELQGGLRNDG